MWKSKVHVEDSEYICVCPHFHAIKHLSAQPHTSGINWLLMKRLWKLQTQSNMCVGKGWRGYAILIVTALKSCYMRMWHHKADCHHKKSRQRKEQRVIRFFYKNPTLWPKATDSSTWTFLFSFWGELMGIFWSTWSQVMKPGYIILSQRQRSITWPGIIHFPWSSAKTHESVKKLMATMFWNAEGMILKDFFNPPPPGQIVKDFQILWNFLDRLKKADYLKKPDIWVNLSFYCMAMPLHTKPT